jgi:ATP-dependent DNA ligase
MWPYSERRAILDDLRLAELGVDGLVLKHQSAPYLRGKRTASWRR